MTSAYADKSLDAEQEAAVLATEKAIAVLAGPGSGKTRTLSHRARHLLIEHPDSRALLLTFTNKAAAEMKARALAVGTLAADRIEASTFHGFGAAFLRSHGDLVGIARDFDILDMEERDEFAAAVARERGIANRIVAWSSRRLRGQTMPELVAAFGTAFEEAKRADALVDFDDLVVYPATLLAANAALAAAYGARFRHILVDEFQDTNPVHFAIVKSLYPHAQTISVFADDDQTLMRFAGADAGNVGRFADELGAKPYPLSCNYRCRKEIVTHANRLIAADPAASGRHMRADKPAGDVALVDYATTSDEAAALGEEIADAVVERGVPAASIAVLVRSAFRADELVAALRARGVPVTDWRGAAYEPAERRILITCMSVIRPRLNNRQARKLSELLGRDVLDERDTHAFLEAHTGHPVADALLAVRVLAFEGARPQQIVAQAQAAIAAYDPASGERAVPLVEAVADFERFDPNFTLEHLLTELALKTGGRPPTQGGGVKVGTLHGTKGLEWPTVYLLGLEEGKLPDYRAEDKDAIGDERRACFVGVCRAEDRLVLTFSHYFRVHRQKPSRFLHEMALT